MPELGSATVGAGPDQPSRPDLDAALALLTDVGAAGVVHPSGTLLAHLRGTCERLREWGCGADLCAAGLCHSIYGTEAFRPATISLADRERVRERIGARAERLAWLYCVMVRGSLYENLDRGAPYRVVERTTGAHVALDGPVELADLMTLDLANRLEQLPRTSMSLRRMERDRRRYARAVPLLPAAAVAEMRGVYRPHSPAHVALDGLLRRARRLLTRLRPGAIRESRRADQASRDAPPLSRPGAR